MILVEKSSQDPQGEFQTTHEGLHNVAHYAICFICPASVHELGEERLGSMAKSALVTTALLTGVMLLLLPAEPTAAQMGAPSEFEEWKAQTASYTIKMRIGRKVSMAMSSAMTVTDQGKPVNRHMEVHIFSRRSGAEVKDVVPIVKVMGPDGGSRQLSNITACRVSKHRETEPHFGDNVYLPDGTYTITVTVGTETSAFSIVALKATS